MAKLSTIGSLKAKGFWYEIPTHKKPAKKIRFPPRIPEHLPIVREELDPPEVLLNPEAFRRIGEEVRVQLAFKPAEFFRFATH